MLSLCDGALHIKSSWVARHRRALLAGPATCVVYYDARPHLAAPRAVMS